MLKSLECKSLAFVFSFLFTFVFLFGVAHSQCTLNITCPPSFRINTTINQCDSVAYYPTASAVSNCSLSSTITYQPLNGSTLVKGINMVVVRANDTNGNTANCFFNVTVQDRQLPQISCACSSIGATGGQSCVSQSLGNAASFSVLGASTVTNTGSTVINGSVGVSPGSAVTGFPPGVSTDFTIHKSDPLANSAQTDATAAYTMLANRSCNMDLTGQNLGSRVLTPGTYCFTTSAGLNGPVTFDAKCNASAQFIFKIGSTLITSSASSINLINGAQSCNVFWQVGSSATLGTTTAFTGTIIALQSVTLNNGASVNGRVIALTGAVTLDTNRVFLDVSTANTRANASDNCPNVTINYNSSGINRTVIATAIDTSGNSATCSSSVSTMAPQSIMCPPNQRLNASIGNCSAIANFSANTSNCRNCSLSYSSNSGTRFPVGINNVSVVAHDTIGQIYSCTFQLTVLNVEKPILVCPANISRNICDPVAIFKATVTHNCSKVTFVYSSPSGSSFPPGITNVTVTATDAFQNTANCTFSVFVGTTILSPCCKSICKFPPHNIPQCCSNYRCHGCRCLQTSD